MNMLVGVTARSPALRPVKGRRSSGVLLDLQQKKESMRGARWWGSSANARASAAGRGCDGA